MLWVNLALTYFRTPYASDFNDAIKQLATHYGARPHELQAKLREEAKRASERDKGASRGREVTEAAADIEIDIVETVLANLHAIPPDVLVDATIQTLLSYDQRVWDQEMKVFDL